MQRNANNSGTEKRIYVSTVTNFETVINVNDGEEIRFEEELTFFALSDVQKDTIKKKLLGESLVKYFPFKDNTTWGFLANIISIDFFPIEDPVKFNNCIITIRSQSYTEPKPETP